MLRHQCIGMQNEESGWPPLPTITSRTERPGDSAMLFLVILSLECGGPGARMIVCANDAMSSMKISIKPSTSPRASAGILHGLVGWNGFAQNFTIDILEHHVVWGRARGR